MTNEDINISLNLDADKSLKSLSMLRIEMRDLQKQMEQASAIGDKKLFKELEQRFIDTKDAMKDLREASVPVEDKIASITGYAGKAVGAFQNLAVAFGANSKSSEELFKAFAKAQTITNLAGQLPTLIADFGKMKNMVVGVGAAMKTAFLANPVTIIVAAIAAVAVGIAALTTGLGDNITKMEEWRESMRYNAEQAQTYFEKTISGVENLNKKLQDVRDINLTEGEKEQKQALKNFSIYTNNTQKQLDEMKVLAEERSSMAKKYEEYAAAETDFTLKQQWYDKAEKLDKESLELRNKISKAQTDLNTLQDKYTTKIELAVEEIKKLEAEKKAADDAEKRREKWRTETERLRKEIERAKIEAIDDEILKLEAKAQYEISIVQKTIADEKVKAERILQIQDKLSQDIKKIKLKEQQEREQERVQQQIWLNKNKEEELKKEIDSKERVKDLRISLMKDGFDKEDEQLTLYYNRRFETVKTGSEEEFLLNEEWIIKRAELEIKWEKKKQQELRQQRNDGMQAAAALSNALYNMYTQQMEAELSNVNLSEKQKDSIRRSYAKKRQQAAESEAIISGALSIMQIWQAQATGNAIADAIIKGVLTAAVVVTTSTQLDTIKQQKFAQGGFVSGSGNQDSISAKLMPGEFVMTKAATEAIGVDNLNRLNKNEPMIQRVVVVESDITKKQKNVTRVETRASMKKIK